eukprot:sb/3469725/
MKFWHSSHTFEHPWEMVSQAFWRKYPNEYQSHVYGTDVIERYVDEQGRLHSKRIIISDWKVPSFMKIFYTDPRGYAVEHSIVDPIEKTLTLKSENINAASIFSFQEDIVYKGLGAQTSLQHEAKIRFSASRLVDDAAENWLFGRVSNAACDGLRAMDSIIDKVEAEMQLTLQSVGRTLDESITDAKRSIDESLADAEAFIDSSISDAKSTLDRCRTVEPSRG